MLVGNFPAHWLLIVTADTLLPGWEINSSLLISNWFLHWSKRTDQCTTPTSPPFHRAKLQQGSLPSYSGFILLGGWPRPSAKIRRFGPHPESRFQILEPGICALPPQFLSTRWRCRPVFVTVHWAWRVKNTVRRKDVEGLKFMKVNPFNILALHVSWQALK